MGKWAVEEKKETSNIFCIAGNKDPLLIYRLLQGCHSKCAHKQLGIL
jgi:Icc-related predicted phosphoesterase